MSSLLMDRKVAKYNKAVAAYDEWKSLHPNGAMLTSEEAARGDALERAMEREDRGVQRLRESAWAMAIVRAIRNVFEGNVTSSTGHINPG